MEVGVPLEMGRGAYSLQLENFWHSGFSGAPVY